jgi:hypothetical protein
MSNLDLRVLVWTFAKKKKRKETPLLIHLKNGAREKGP